MPERERNLPKKLSVGRRNENDQLGSPPVHMGRRTGDKEDNPYSWRRLVEEETLPKGWKNLGEGND